MQRKHNFLRKLLPTILSGLKMRRILRYGTPTRALQLLKDSSQPFGEERKYLLAAGLQYCLLCEIEEAKKYVKRAIKADSSLKAEFLDDQVWDSF